MSKLDRQHFDLLFQGSLTVMLLTIGWVIPYKPLIKIQVDIVLLVLSLITAYELQDERAGQFTWLQWSSGLLIGGVVVALSLRLEPIWQYSAELLVRGRVSEAAAHLNGHNHTNLILFIGLAITYVAMVGLIRRGLLKFLNISETQARVPKD